MKSLENKINSLLTSKYSLLFIAVILCITAFIIYSNSFQCAFVFDDYRSIVLNNSLKDNSIFTQFNIQRYVALVTFALNYKINGLNVTGYHIINLLIHFANGLLVYILIKTLLRLHVHSLPDTSMHVIPLIVALLFLVHPVQTQAVTYIVQREASLATLFVLASILLYISYRVTAAKHYHLFTLSLLFCLLAYKTKENTASLPFVIFLIEIIFFPQKANLKKKLLLVAPYVLLIIVIPLSLINVNTSAGDLFEDLNVVLQETETIDRSVYFFTQQRVIMTYIKLLLFPSHQAFDYYFPLSFSLFEIKTFLSFLFIVALIIFSLAGLKKFPLVSFGILWFFIFLTVESSFFPIRDVIWEHRMYLPSIGFIFIITCLLSKLKWKLFIPLSLVIIIALGTATYSRNKVWKDELTLFKDSTAKYPQKARNHFSLGSAYMRKKMYKEAIRTLQHAIELDPTIVGARVNLSICYWETRQIEKARIELLIVLQQRPAYPLASYKLASIYMSRGDIDKAFDILIKAKKFSPSHARVNALLADIYCQQDDLGQAFYLFKEAETAGLASADSYYNFAVCLLKKGKIAESRVYLLKSAELNPGDAVINYAIALGYEQERNFAQAVHYYRLFLKKSSTQTPQTIDAQQRLRRLEIYK
ncbi:MAG: hypothetical protein A2Y62_18390 [Candidatus Fischerbacteria bacterium RBG_13_37_8]|uniref:Uncharacterized protein n=1 Tax=Candidatus Fischerbacteria bacterium RBG_13_37_8 TaxID=1817863 RepID=A0A1F5V9C5_9BACT|nr:MAG: hypothetical protein A2Y62_18390 [Candidatus Fischerbacteria bacterium RBG_13_37_8]